MSITGKAKDLRIAYIGGGSRGWAWGFMTDLAMDEQLCGTIRLYDIDRDAAERNRIIGGKISAHPDAKSRWTYAVADSLQSALTGADFVVISILPGTFDEMAVDVHLPVMSSWSEKLLKIAPCRYMGSLPEPGMIIMGHNYRSHFTPLHKAEVGDEVIFEDVEGKLYRFRIADIQILHRTEGEKLESEYPLTLFTCTPGGLERRILRCAYTEES